MTKKNYIFQKYITNACIWCIDETFFSKTIAVFSVINLYSGCCIGCIISTETNRLVSSDIIELFEQILDDAEYPIYVHGDRSPLYDDLNFKKWFIDKGISFSFAIDAKFGNQVIESFNNSLKQKVAMEMLITDHPEIINFKRHLPEDQRKWNMGRRAKDKVIRDSLWNTGYFEEYGFDLVVEALQSLNLRTSPVYKNYTRKEIELKSFLSEKANFKLYKKGTTNANELIVETTESLDEIWVQPEQTGVDLIEKIKEAIKPEQQEVKDLLILGFSVMLEENKTIKEELLIQKRLREEKEIRRNKRLATKRRQKKTPITKDHLNASLKIVGTRRSYNQARLRVSLILLFVTGVRASELLFITSKQVEDLLVLGFIPITRNKMGEFQKKAYLTESGRRFIKQAQPDIAIVLMTKESDNDYFFTACDRNKPLSREHFQKMINNNLEKLAIEYPGSYFTSHSFRCGFINALWRKNVDLSIIRQIVGHKRVETTALYLTDLEEVDIRSIVEGID
jgi:site-specific recombinase XerD